MMRSSALLPMSGLAWGLVAASALALTSCNFPRWPVPSAPADSSQRDPGQSQPQHGPIRGVVSWASSKTLSPTSFRLQAGLTEVANAATVSLIEAQGGNTVASSVTDERGGFVLTFQNFTPVSGAPYTLEAVKGLAVGGKPNRPGAAAVRVRSLLFWNGGWQSLTNSVPGVGISVSPATTAIATIASLKQSARQSVDLTELVGKVSGGDFDATGTDLSRTADFDPVVRLVDNALTLDQDPVAAIAYDSVRGTYRLATGVPLGAGIVPAIPTPGQTLTIHGLNFDPTPGRQVFWFGNVPVTTWTVSPDRMAVTMTVPGSAISGPLRVDLPGGIQVTLDPFLRLRGTVATLAGNGTGDGQDGVGAAASFVGIRNIRLDRQGNLVVPDIFGNRLRKVTPAGVVTTTAGSGTAGNLDGAPGSAQFYWPVGVAADTQGFLFVVDYSGHLLRKIAPDGNVTTLAGGAPGFANGTGGAAQFLSPADVVSDSQGNLFVADYSNERIRKITPAGVVTTFAGSGVRGPADGDASTAQFIGPVGITIDTSGNLFVAERDGNRIRKITPEGVVTTIAGQTTSGYRDDVGTAAQFNMPYGIAVDGGGNLYVADCVNNLVRKITPAGLVSTVAGSGISDYQDGTLAQAAFINPTGMAVDESGILYVGDSGTRRVRIVTP